jgi:hypothetical protein
MPVFTTGDHETVKQVEVSTYTVADMHAGYVAESGSTLVYWTLAMRLRNTKITSAFMSLNRSALHERI